MSIQLDAARPTAYGAGQRDGTRRAFLVLLAMLPPVVLAVLILPTPIALAAALPAWLVLPWVWKRPIRGLYIIFGAALLLEQLALHFPDSITDTTGFFENLNNSNSALNGIPITPAEIVMLAAVLIWVASSISRRTLEFPKGPIVRAYVAFVLVVLFAEIQGLVAGGNFLISLWELRPQAYGLVAFILAAALVRTRADLLRLAGIFAVIVALKGLIADYRYLVTLHRDMKGIEAIMAHEESYFFALFLIAALGIILWSKSKRIQLGAIALTAIVGLALNANQRRAGVLALTLGIAVFVILAARFDAANRRRLVTGAVILVIVLGGILIGFWDHQSGLLGEIVRPFHSLFAPDARDASSNLYRQAEDANLLLTFRSSPIVGIGFGRPMLYAFHMVDISGLYPLWNYIPHNTLLWIGMRMGIVGYVTFFGLLAMAVLQACRVARDTRDILLRGVAIFAVVAIAMELAVGYVDLQLDLYRNLIFLGALLGVIHRLPAIARGDAERAITPSGQSERIKTRVS
jgi:O-antigen ligase